MVTSALDNGKTPMCSRNVSPILPPISLALAITPSRVLYAFNHLAAVLGPHFGIPGTLSTLSPVSARKSMIRSGGTPNFSSTPAGVSVVSLMVFTSVTLSVTSCAKSLSPVEISTDSPDASACFASVPMTSSASTPGTASSGNPNALIIACSGWICSRSSSGIFSRFALYSAYKSSRNVLPDASNTTTIRSAPVESANLLSIEITPRIAPTGWPVLVVSGGNA